MTYPRELTIATGTTVYAGDPESEERIVSREVRVSVTYEIDDDEADVPLLAAVVSPAGYAIFVIIGATLIVLGVLGALAARVGGASPVLGAMRVLFWGAMAMGVTAGVGAIFRLAV